MSKTIITRKEINVPVGVLLEVEDLLLENNLSHITTGTDNSSDEIILEVEYTREEKGVIRQIQQVIDEYEEEEDDDE